MPERTGTPRVLRISFEFQVPPELKKNITASKIDKALDTIRDRVLGLVEAVFPWADRVRVRKQWIYNWTDETEDHELPSTEYNTPQR